MSGVNLWTVVFDVELVHGWRELDLGVRILAWAVAGDLGVAGYWVAFGYTYLAVITHGKGRVREPMTKPQGK